jgi:hypothetical protein
LVARELETQGITTVIIGSARDIVEYCGVPRFLYTDFPLGNPCGPPWDRQAQARIAQQAVTLLETAIAPRQTKQAAATWPSGHAWRPGYNYVGAENAVELAATGAARRQRQMDERRDADSKTG